MTHCPDLRNTLQRLAAGEELDLGQLAAAAETIFHGQATDGQIGALLLGLQQQGITVGGLTTLADQMLAFSEPLTVTKADVDIVGTGGDGHNSVNISTMAAITVAATGVTVIKHGNRAASSACGAADVLAELGINLDLPIDQVALTADELGITFAFAQKFHPAMRHVAAVRRELGIRTPFNLLGPLTNPAQPPRYLLGVAQMTYAPILAGVLQARGQGGFVVHGHQGFDELVLSGPGQVWAVGAGEIVQWEFDPRDCGLPVRPIEDLAGGDAAVNAAVVRKYLAGEQSTIRETVLLNAAVARTAHCALADITDYADFVTAVRHQYEQCAQAIDSGAVADLVSRWRQRHNAH